jgi:drug/metabolite transporter (DMT)-like permease
MRQKKVIFILVMCVFGSIGLFVRNINLASSQIALVRGGVGSIFLLFSSLLTRQYISWQSIKANLVPLTISGIAIGVNWIFLFEAYRYTTIANATLSYYMAPVFVVLLSVPVLQERLSLIKLLSIIGASLGMFLIVGNSNGVVVVNHLIGLGYGIFAAIFYASVILVNKHLKGLSGLESTVVQLGAASLVLLPYVLVTQKFSLPLLDVKTLILLLIVGVIHTGITYYLYFSILQKLPAQSIAILSYIDPLSAIILSRIFLREYMTLKQIIGGIFILGAAFLSEYCSNNRSGS